MKTQGIETIAIIGTGMIGASMAALFTGNGYKTIMYGINETELKNGLTNFNNNYDDLEKKGLVSSKQAAAAKARLKTTQSYQDLADADFIFECVVEKLEIKHSVYGEVEKYCSNFKAIVSSSSAISTDDLCKGLSKFPERMAVAHPYNPPHLVPCIEIVKGEQTAKEALDVIYSVMESCGRAPVLMNKSAPGFIANRLQHALYREAVYMVEQGIASPQDIDKALMTSFAPRYTSIGLFQHFDYAGLDMIKSIHDYLFPDLCNAKTTQDLLENAIKTGNLGCKTGQGVLDWTNVDMDEFRRKAAAPYLQFFNWSLPED